MRGYASQSATFLTNEDTFGELVEELATQQVFYSHFADGSSRKLIKPYLVNIVGDKMLLQFVGIGGILKFSGINVTLSVISIGALISTITVIVYTLKQILESAVGVELYYTIRFYFEYLLQEVKAVYQMIVNYIKGATVEND